ncbi:MAG: sensor histidine kinase [Halobacteriaceae archaeon]
MGICLSVAHFALEAGTVVTVLKSLIVVALSVTVVYSGYDLRSRPISEAGGRRALAVMLSVTAFFVLLAVIVDVIWAIEASHHSDTDFMLLFAGSLGAAVGAQTGLYEAQSREKLAQNQALTKLLQVNQRVLRHNLRNELTVALGHLENVETRVGADDPDVVQVREHLQEVLDISDRARRVVSIWETDTCATFDLRDLVAERISHLHRQYPGTSVSATVPAGRTVDAHVALPRAIDEVLENAVLHNDPTVQITVRTTRPRPGVIALEIADDGTGLDPLERRALFQQSETQLAHGRGLGLWLVYWIVTKSGGELKFRDNEPTGTVVELRLPAD